MQDETCPLMTVGPSLVMGFAAPFEVRPFVLSEGGSGIAALGQIQSWFLGRAAATFPVWSMPVDFMPAGRNCIS